MSVNICFVVRFAARPARVDKALNNTIVGFCRTRFTMHCDVRQCDHTLLTVPHSTTYASTIFVCCWLQRAFLFLNGSSRCHFFGDNFPLCKSVIGKIVITSLVSIFNEWSTPVSAINAVVCSIAGTRLEQFFLKYSDNLSKILLKFYLNFPNIFLEFSRDFLENFIKIFY